MNLITTEIRAGTPLAGRYRVRQRLGTGGMATVFLAEDERLGREVAVKRLHTDAPEESLRRFKREARLGAALNHPNLVSVYDTVAADEGALIVMEHVGGRPLSEVAGGEPMAPSRALPILRDVARALDHAHGEGVIHRDVKPSNILIGDDGVVKLADLGIARAIGATQITSEGSVVGTLPYMSPERLATPGGGGPESDVYSLGAVAFELLSGRPPSEPSTTGEAAYRTIDLARDWPGGPARAVAVLERALDEDPGRRQPTAGRFVDELERALTGAAPRTAAWDAGPRTAARDRAPFRARDATPRTSVRDADGSRRGRAVGVGLLALGLLAVAGVALSNGGGDEDPGSESEPPAAAASKDSGNSPQPEPESTPAPGEQQAASEPTSGAALNDLGFSLIEQGRYEEAIPVLQRAVDTFGEGSQDLTYAYALFNLGNALRLAGRPEEAIPVLQSRLEIPNQRGAVMRELAAAMAAAGEGFRDEGGEGDEGGVSGPPFGNANGQDKDED